MKRTTILAVLMIILAITLTFTTLLPRVTAIDVKITSITPANRRGKVGDSVRIIGTINKTDGLYQIWFGSQKVKEANATANVVNATFSVPKLSKGNYTVALLDIGAAVNATTWFIIETAYYIEAKKPALPEQLQEGDTVEIWANLTGGASNTVYTANITVKVPAPASGTYWALVTLSNTTDTGEGHNFTVVYPNHFTGTPHTNYTGTYTIAFNKTLATTTFFVGLTNSTEYHRNQLVGIKALGYKPNENATIKVTFGGRVVEPRVLVNATEEGAVITDWPVPSNATIGTYILNITSTSLNPTTKNPPDVQNFTVPGFNVNITTRNLAKEAVQDVAVRIFEAGKSVKNATSTAQGLVQLKLEVGIYTCNAFYKGEKVGERLVGVTNDASIDFLCNLTNLKILVTAVFGSSEIVIPEAKIYLTPVNQTLTTNITGIAVAHSLLPNRTYVLNASRYGKSFNLISIPTLLVGETAIDWYDVTLICPTLTLRVNVTNANGEPANNVLVKVKESIGGLHNEGNTNTEGIITFSTIFGSYSVGVYDVNGIKLNETTVTLFQNRNVSIPCKLYGLTVLVKVVDYFGQPISNANVKLQREGWTPLSQNTQSDGIATFNSITGGNLTAAVYLSDQAQPIASNLLSIDSSRTIEIKLEKYVILAGALIETSYLTTTIIIVITVLLVILIEFYRRRHFKPTKSQSEVEPE